MVRLKLLSQITLKEAQSMFSDYCILKPNHVLSYNLAQILPGSIDIIQNVRAFYNQAIISCYPNETTIKAAFLNEILFKMKHDITIFELPVGGSRVDLCKINGTSVAYEIKTDFDNLRRLQTQISNYQRVFEEIYVICSPSHLSAIETLLPSYCGIYMYSFNSKKRCHFTLYRAACLNTFIDAEQQLLLFGINELYYAFAEYRNMSKATAIENILRHHSAAEINSAFKTMLKQRFASQWSFLESNHTEIYEIDYQWFFQNQTNPRQVYGS